MAKQKLELTWIGKDKRPLLEPRILVELPEHSYHARERKSEKDIFDNMLIHGDNLLALKALEQEFAGKVKCIYIDPPYNTGSAFEYYDDGLEHSIWLGLMRERLVILKNLLRRDGSIWISIDDNEQAYLKVLLDEIFGRSNFITNVTIEVSPPNGVKIAHAHKTILKEKEFIILYAKNKEAFRISPQYKKAPTWDKHFNKFIKNKEMHMSKWEVVPLRDVIGEMRQSFENKEFMLFASVHADEIFQPVGNARFSRNPRYCTDSIVSVDESHGYMAYKGKQVQLLSKSMKNINGEYVLARLITDSWTDISFNNLFQEGGVDFKNAKKPEMLIARILNMSSDPGDIVLDSFLGSGTTAAVAHKMGRWWIGIEMGEHCFTHCVPRLKKVVNGEDAGGVTSSANWKGGGGFRVYKLGPTMVKEDKWGNPIINEEFNASMLAEAMCKLEGFVYAPDPEVFWRHGHSTETDFIYVTTQTLTKGQLDQLSGEVGSGRSLLVCCSAFRADEAEFENMTIKKIPMEVLKKCEWGKDDYSLRVKELPDAFCEELDLEGNCL